MKKYNFWRVTLVDGTEYHFDSTNELTCWMENWDPTDIEKIVPVVFVEFKEEVKDAS